MSTDENKALVRRFYEGYKAGNIEKTFELVSPEVIHHGLSGMTFNYHGWKQAEVGLFVAFPDFEANIEFQLAEGDKVTTRWMLHGSHQGVFLGIPPTGRRVTLSAIAIDRVANGKIVEHWTEADLMGLRRQISA
jgi:predicted ester cyclase